MIWLDAIVNDILTFRISSLLNGCSTCYFADNLSPFLALSLSLGGLCVRWQPKSEHICAALMVTESERRSGSNLRMADSAAIQSSVLLRSHGWMTVPSLLGIMSKSRQVTCLIRG